MMCQQITFSKEVLILSHFELKSGILGFLVSFLYLYNFTLFQAYLL